MPRPGSHDGTRGARRRRGAQIRVVEKGAWELKATEFFDPGPREAGGDEVAEGVGGIVAAETLVVDVGFEHIGGVIGVVLEEPELIRDDSRSYLFVNVVVLSSLVYINCFG